MRSLRYVRVVMGSLLLTSLAAVASESTNRPVTIDLMPEFFKAIDSTSTNSQQKSSGVGGGTDFFHHHRNLYEQVLLREPLSTLDIEKHLQELAPLIPGMRSSYAPLKKVIEQRIPYLAKHYDYAFSPDDFYIWPSFFSSNGQLREYNGKMRVFFGVDVVTYVADKYKNHQILVDHETFHLVHSRKSAAADRMLKGVYNQKHLCPLYENLWVEGLATYASQLGNPESPLTDILFSEDVRQFQQAERALAKDYLNNLLSTDSAYLKRYFWMNSDAKDLPQRSAYYMGLRVAMLIGKRYSLARMMMFDEQQVKTEVTAALKSLAGDDSNRGKNAGDQ